MNVELLGDDDEKVPGSMKKKFHPDAVCCRDHKFQDF